MAPSGGLEERKRRARPPRPHRRGFGPRSCRVARVATGDFGKRLERHGYVLKNMQKSWFLMMHRSLCMQDLNPSSELHLTTLPQFENEPHERS